jgi:hypothetical protein
MKLAAPDSARIDLPRAPKGAIRYDSMVLDA